MGERPRGALPCRTAASTASELVFSPDYRHLLLPNLLPFYNHCPWSSMSQSCLVGQTPWPISSFLPPSPSSAAVPVPWAALKLSAPQTEVPFFLLIAFSLKARLSYHQNHSQMTGSDGLTSQFLIIIQGMRVKWPGSRGNALPHRSGAPLAGCGRVFMGLSALSPMPSVARSHVPFVHWPQDTARGLTQGGHVVSTEMVSL